MPRLEPKGRELRALAEIRQNIAPLIARRISADFRTKRITDLAIYNHLHFFTYELDKIPLDLVCEQDLTPEDFGAFLGGLHRLLSLLEGMVDGDIFHSAKITPTFEETPLLSSADEQEAVFPLGYPGIAELLRRVSGSSNSSELSSLILLPETVEKAAEASQIVASFNAENLTRSNKATENDSLETRSVVTSYPKVSKNVSPKSDLEILKQSQKCLTCLWNALTENITMSSCTSTHVAKLQIRHPRGTTETSDEIEHKIFVSCCTGQDMWQETTCRIVSKLVQNSNLKNVHNVCKVIKGSLKNGRTLDLSVHDGRIMRNHEAAMLAHHPPVWPVLPLCDMLRDIGQDLRRYYKVVLALNLAHALLRLYHPGMQSKWTSQDIFFLFDQSASKIREAYNPYLAYSLFLHQKPENSDLTGSRKLSLLIAFGKLLLEIALGRPIEDSELHSRADVALLTIAEEQDEELMENVPAGFVDAMTQCLEANQDDDYDDDYDDEDSEEDNEVAEETQCREILFIVVGNLENAKKDFPAQKGRRNDAWKDPNHPLELEVSRNIRNLMHAVTLGKVQSPGAEVSITSVLADTLEKSHFRSPGQLFDECGHGISASDIRSAYANTFLDKACDFHTQNIKCLPSDQRIRIAILDTGVDDSNPFFRGIRKRRAKRDMPFKEVKSFIGSSSIDTLGHGTDVAAIILRIAPEADLYIAKISEGREVAETDQIAKAIEWAQSCNVHVINLSFGLSEDNEAIEKAIGEAENNGIIVFAAASNYGGNARRSFPARMDKVICIHASDGNGNRSGLDPSPKTGRENFSTLGVAIESVWNDGGYLAGTSYSTPVAVGFAANVLQYVQHSRELEKKHRKRVFSRVGMKNILLAMSDLRDEYHYITPWRWLWDGDGSVEVAFKIKQALKDDKY